jgi:Ca2+-binding RTX toxin-like protein
MARNARLAIIAAVIVAAMAPPLTQAGSLPTCFGREVTIPGSAESGSQSGEAGEHNVMMGFAGDDELYGANLADFICGGTGNDPVLFGYQGDDRLSGNGGDDTLAGGVGADRIFGRWGDDIIAGGPGIDYVDGGQGTDTCVADTEDTVVNCEL